MFSSLSTRLLACTAYKFGESPTEEQETTERVVTRDDIFAW